MAQGNSAKKKTVRTGSTASKGQRASEGSERTSLPAETELAFDVALWISIGVCTLLMISNFGAGGAAGRAVSGVLFGLFGLCNYAFPPVLIGALLLALLDHGQQMGRRILCLFLVFIFSCAFCELLINGDRAYGGVSAFEDARLFHTGGGWLGGGAASLLVRYLGLAGAYVVVTVLILAAVMGLVGRSAARSLQTVPEEADNLRERAAERRAAISRARQEEYLARQEERFERAHRRAEASRLRQQQTVTSTEAWTSYAGETEFKARENPDLHRAGSGDWLGVPVTDEPVRKASSDEMKEIVIHLHEEEEGPLLGDPKQRESAAPSMSAISQELVSPATVVPPSFAVHGLDMEEEEPVQEEPRTPVSLMPPQPEESVPAAPETDMSFAAAPKPSPKRRSSAAASADEESRNKEEAGEGLDLNPAESGIPRERYKFPPVSLLTKGERGSAKNMRQTLRETAEKLVSTLRSFGLNVTVTDVSLGPAVTRYEIQPESGVKVSRIVNLSDDLALNLAASSIRIEAPIPGKSAVGIEVPNKETVIVSFREMMESREFQEAKSPLCFAAGRDIAGQVIISDIAKMPHLLIAGATGSGKSVCINTMIMSLLYKTHPDDVKMVMIDPKVVELSVYNGIPHLLMPVVTDPKKAASALNWAVHEMDERYDLLAEAGVRDVASYNALIHDGMMTKTIDGESREVLTASMPQILVIVDELADLMMVSSSEVEVAICRLAQKARAAGIHLVIATQRPSVNVITGLIKANVPSRIAFSVTSSVDSRTILDMGGAEKLLGRGDMLYYPQGLPKPIRVQGAFVSDEEVSRVVDYIKKKNPEYCVREREKQAAMVSAVSATAESSSASEEDDSRDPLFEKAARLVVGGDKASIGNLQRHLKIGFNRAARIMDALAEAGIVSPDEGSTKARDVLLTEGQLDEVLGSL